MAIETILAAETRVDDVRLVGFDEAVHKQTRGVPEFDPGHGMSAGAVHVPWWVHTGVPMLLDRYAARHETDGHRDD